MKSILKKDKKGLYFNIAVFIFVSVINLILILNHEMWEDEVQAWLIARDCRPLSVFNITSLEGHPALWYFILMPLAKLNFPAITLYFISYTIMELTLFTVLFLSPFNIPLKLIISLSPMFIYTYSAISRSYCVCALLIVLLALFYKNKDKRPVFYGVLLALLLQTHIIMAGMVFIICVVWLFETIILIKNKNEAFKKNILGMSIPLFSALFLLFELRSVFSADYVGTSSSVTTSSNKIFFMLGFCLVYAVIILVIFKFIKNKDLYKLILISSFTVFYQIMIYVFIYGCNTSRLIIFAYIFIFFIWNYFLIENKESRIRLVKIASVIAILGFSVLLSTKVYVRAAVDLKIPYTDCKNAAKFIKENIDPSEPIIVNTYAECMNVAAYLDNNQLYDPFEKKELSFIKREKNESRVKWLKKDEFIDIAKSQRTNEDYVYMLISSISRVDDIDEIIENSEILYDSTDKETMIGETFIVLKYNFNE